MLNINADQDPLSRDYYQTGKEKRIVMIFEHSRKVPRCSSNRDRGAQGKAKPRAHEGKGDAGNVEGQRDLARANRKGSSLTSRLHRSVEYRAPQGLGPSPRNHQAASRRHRRSSPVATTTRNCRAARARVELNPTRGNTQNEVVLQRFRSLKFRRPNDSTYRLHPEPD